MSLRIDESASELTRSRYNIQADKTLQEIIDDMDTEGNDREADDIEIMLDNWEHDLTD